MIALCRKRVFAAAGCIGVLPLTRPLDQRTRFLIQLLPEAVQEKASGPADILAVAHHARVTLLTSSTSSFLCRLDPSSVASHARRGDPRSRSEPALPCSSRAWSRLESWIYTLPALDFSLSFFAFLDRGSVTLEYHVELLWNSWKYLRA